MNGLSEKEARLIRAAILPHNGPSMCPGWSRKRQRELTEALDKLRVILLEKGDGAELACERTDEELFYEAYLAIGKGRDFVRIHRIRERLGWGEERFDGVLIDLARKFEIELHGGDPSSMTKEEIRGSYVDGTGWLYIAVSRRGGKHRLVA